MNQTSLGMDILFSFFFFFPVLGLSSLLHGGLLPLHLINTPHCQCLQNACMRILSNFTLQERGLFPWQPWVFFPSFLSALPLLFFIIRSAIRPRSYLGADHFVPSFTPLDVALDSGALGWREAGMKGCRCTVWWKKDRLHFKRGMVFRPQRFREQREDTLPPVSAVQASTCERQSGRVLRVFFFFFFLHDWKYWNMHEVT